MSITSSLSRFFATAILLAFAIPAAQSQVTPLDPRWVVTRDFDELDGDNLQPSSPALVKSLGDAAEYLVRWQLPADAKHWAARRPEVERAFRKAIGLERLPERTPLNARVVSSHDMGGYTIENIIFESRPGFLVTANVYRPKPAPGKRPAILCPIGHYLPAGKATRDIQARCISLVKMGFVVLVYDAIGHGERLLPGNIHHEAGYALMPLGQTVAGWMVWDSMRAIDYLLAQPDVNPARIGITGNSGGGLNTLFTAALDPRIRTAVVVGYTFEFNNWLKYAGTHCTCTQLPGMFRGMEWFEIAGLIAPRPVMMLQGDRDDIFPISGARRAAGKAMDLYALLGYPRNARFDEVAGQPHAYSRPYREKMYGWMAAQLLGKGTGEPIPERDVEPLSEQDPRLLCDPQGTLLPHSPTVIDLARKEALETVAKLPKTSERMMQSVRELTAPPEAKPHYMEARSAGKTEVQNGTLEKLYFNSEDGVYIPALLWRPSQRAARTVVLLDSRGKQAVAESGLIEPLLAAGFAVFSPDLRGRGETLGVAPRNSFRLTANQVMFGRPLAGRRAFDLMRALDCLGRRKDISLQDLAVVGIEDDSLPALLAATVDPRIRLIGMSGYFHSFVSQITRMDVQDRKDLIARWNAGMRLPRLKGPDYEVDLGSVIPGTLASFDVPQLIQSLAPRKVLFCAARDQESRDAEPLRARFKQLLDGANGLRYEAAGQLDARLLLDWLQR